MTQVAPLPAWHSPRFEQVLCGSLSDRERLGLPDHYVAGRLDDLLVVAYDQLHAEPRAQLLAILESRTATLAERIASGNLLAMLGDPRLVVEEPQMLAITGGEVRIGLDTHEIAGVLEDFAGLGVDPAWIEKECPRHRVSLKPYRIARFPVTNVEYRTFLLETGHTEIPTSWHFRRFPQGHANHPVYTVSAISADAYAAWLARRTGRGFRLPTEAEWEYAAAGPEGLDFPWGRSFDADLANTAETGLFNTSPVGAFRGGESHCGAADMAGNIEEYVADCYAPYPGGSFIADHLAAIHGTYRVARGGSFARFRDLARTRRRHGHNPRSLTYAMGFRVAETP